MINIDAYLLRLDWIDAIIAETIYGTGHLPADGYASVASWKSKLKGFAYTQGCSAALHELGPEVPAFLADVPELAEAWQLGYSEFNVGYFRWIAARASSREAER